MSEVTVAVRAQPGARRDEIVGLRNGVLVVRVSAPAHEGRANQALCRLLARQFGVRRSRVTIVRGERSRDKQVRIEGVDAARLSDVLRDIPKSGR